MTERWNVIPRQNPAALEAAQRSGSMEIVEVNYAEAEARRQAARCLRCNVNTIFDTKKCVACNGCVDVCPENLIRLVGLREAIQDIEELAQYAPEDLDEGAVMMKDESTCIRCAMCASRCPTHAILMQRFDFRRECVSVAAPNPKILYATV
jgi:ferredoxin